MTRRCSEVTTRWKKRIWASSQLTEQQELGTPAHTPCKHQRTYLSHNWRTQRRSTTQYAHWARLHCLTPSILRKSKQGLFSNRPSKSSRTTVAVALERWPIWGRMFQGWRKTSACHRRRQIGQVKMSKGKSRAMRATKHRIITKTWAPYSRCCKPPRTSSSDSLTHKLKIQRGTPWRKIISWGAFLECRPKSHPSRQTSLKMHTHRTKESK